MYDGLRSLIRIAWLNGTRLSLLLAVYLLAMDDESASRKVSDVIFVGDICVNEITYPLTYHRLKHRLNRREPVEDYCSFEAVYRRQEAREIAADALALMNLVLR